MPAFALHRAGFEVSAGNDACKAALKIMKQPNFTNSVEITEDAALLLIGNDAETWHDFSGNDFAEWTTYQCKGCKVMRIFNFTSNVAQYYIQDINA